MRYLINGLAKSEMHIALYYYGREAYGAAIGRAKNVLEIYPDSSSTEAALVTLMSAYAKIGAADAASDARRLLEINFPDNNYLTAHKVY